MTETTVVPHAFSNQSQEFERQYRGGIVAGVDGSKESIAALETAAAIARVRSCPLHVVMVLPPFPSYQVNPGVDRRAEDTEQLRLSMKDSELREILGSVEPGEIWTHEVVVGHPAHELTSVAEGRGAGLLVIGRRRHGAIDRMLGGETTVQVMRMSAVPVLAVGVALDPARTAVVAIDFLPLSIRATRVALDLLGTSGTLYLVNVAPPQDLLPKGFSIPGEKPIAGDVEVRIRSIIDALVAHAGVIVEPVALHGMAVNAIVDFAERVGADLIAAGSHGHSRMERFLLGSVSTGLVREAQCAVLVVPPCD